MHAQSNFHFEFNKTHSYFKSKDSQNSIYIQMVLHFAIATFPGDDSPNFWCYVIYEIQKWFDAPDKNSNIRNVT